VPIDIERLFKGVVGQVFGNTANVEFFSDPKYAHDWWASVSPEGDGSREIRIRATYEWFSAQIPAHDVGTIVFEYDDDESAKEQALRELALVMLAYMQGDGSVGFERTRIRRRRRPFVAIDRDGKRWVLGPGPRRSSIRGLQPTN
jgi:hypothetical protein